MKSVKERLATAIQQSEQMLELAREEEWDKVEEIQKQHSTLITDLASANFEENDIHDARKAIENIQKLDQQTEALAQIRKEQIVKEKQQQDKADKMKKAFGAFK
ncbi:flagellar protein FliT [Neptuniibacter caesariensis]|uniref:Flagellar protein FliT n=1 Tax=Neptuniibacter caesariensis TaxID=207954 RepID=A0A7U8GR88_NEPCE|nr:flagellar protein FliT [Neptuniibacter caesariensis]EAR60086.1 hypothetical protein MED92_17142 [Oceanospirillum sp. MED92] [Neptuniibacter caesariensis]